MPYRLVEVTPAQATGGARGPADDAEAEELQLVDAQQSLLCPCRRTEPGLASPDDGETAPNHCAESP